MFLAVFSGLYLFCAGLLALYTLGHGVLLLQRWRPARPSSPPPPVPDAELPTVLIQLPLYNEPYVAVRLLDAIARLDYPAHKLRVQILDDSTDQTTALISAHVRRLGLAHVEHRHRSTRTEYKAGALKAGLAQDSSALVAIFDADFLPPPHFLRATVPYLCADPRLALVQTRWGHLNPAENWITRAQVLAIDTHFLIEQRGRSQAGWFVPFNGSGGVWRRSAIDDAGGWSAETLTEDLDLSFRAQLRGWHALFVPELLVPAELPAALSAYRQQQARWAKGCAQNLKRLGWRVWTAPFPLSTRLFALQHLAQYLPHALMLILLFITPWLLLMGGLSQLPLAPLGLVGLIPPLLYAISQYEQGGAWYTRLLAFPALLLLGTGLIWQNTLAIASGLGQGGGEFLRTPKFGQNTLTNTLRPAKDPHWGAELAWIVYALWGAWVAWQTHQSAFLPYFLVHAGSFAFVRLWDGVNSWQIQRHASKTVVQP